MDTDRDKLDIALLRLYKLDKYLYNVASRLQLVFGEDLPNSPGVRGYTDGIKVTLTDSWLNASEHEQETTVTHETLHVISKHVLIASGLTNINPRRMNVAADLSIANIQISLGQNPPILAGFPNFSDYEGKDMLEIYAMLKDEDGDKDQGHPEHGDGSGENDESEDGHALTSEQEFELDQIIEQAAMQAEAENHSTNLSRGALRDIHKSRATKIAWDKLLTKSVNKLKSDSFNWAKPNRRMFSQIYLPTYREEEEFEAIMAMDVSGSVGQKPLSAMCAAAQYLLDNYVSDLHLISFDDKVVDFWQLEKSEKIINLNIEGYGGTDVNVVYDHLVKLKKKPKVLIIATDGYIPIPYNPKYPVIWIIVNNPGFKCDYGKIIHLDTETL